MTHEERLLLAKVLTEAIADGIEGGWKRIRNDVRALLVLTPEERVVSTSAPLPEVQTTPSSANEVKSELGDAEALEVGEDRAL